VQHQQRLELALSVFHRHKGCKCGDSYAHLQGKASGQSAWVLTEDFSPLSVGSKQMSLRPGEKNDGGPFR